MPARGQSKKTTPSRVFSFFLLRPRRKAREGEAPLGAGTGPEPKKNTTQGVFFCSGPGARQGKEKPRWAPARGQSKKRHLLWPRAGAQRGFSFPCLSPGPEQKKHPGWCFSFALALCRRPTGLLLPLPFAGAAAKKTWVVFFFFCSGPVPARGFSFPCLSPGSEQKKNTLGGVFFCCGPARTLTHSLRACLPMPPPRRVVFFFFAAAPPAPGWCLFFCCGPARTITHSLWAGAISARPGWCFFLLRPRRVFLDNNKNVWGTSSGLKRPGGATAKKKTPLPFKGSLKGSIRVL